MYNTIEELDKITGKISDDNLDFFVLPQVINSSLTRMHGVIKNEEYFSAYVFIFGKDKIEEYNNLSDIIEFFVFQTGQVQIEHQKAYNYDLERKSKFVELTEDILNETSYILKTALISDLDKQIINSSLVDFYNQHPESIIAKISFEYRFKYIRHLLENLFADYSSVIELHPYFNKIKQASKLFKLIKIHNDEHAKYLMTIRDPLKEAIEEYDLATKTLLNKSV